MAHTCVRLGKPYFGAGTAQRRECIVCCCRTGKKKPVSLLAVRLTGFRVRYWGLTSQRYWITMSQCDVCRYAE